MTSRLRIDELVSRLGTGPIAAPEGITLPNAEKAGSGTLDWYEEGVWTPGITASTPGTLTASVNISYARYVRVGAQVTATFRMNPTAFALGTATGCLRITGLPFASNPSSGFVGACFTNNIDLGGPNLVLWLNPGSTFMEFYSSNDNAGWACTPPSGLTAGDELIGTITYFT